MQIRRAASMDRFSPERWNSGSGPPYEILGPPPLPPGAWSWCSFAEAVPGRSGPTTGRPLCGLPSTEGRALARNVAPPRPENPGASCRAAPQGAARTAPGPESLDWLACGSDCRATRLGPPRCAPDSLVLGPRAGGCWGPARPPREPPTGLAMGNLLAGPSAAEPPVALARVVIRTANMRRAGAGVVVGRPLDLWAPRELARADSAGGRGLGARRFQPRDRGTKPGRPPVQHARVARAHRPPACLIVGLGACAAQTGHRGAGP